MCQSAMSANVSWAHKSSGDKGQTEKPQLCTELDITPEQETGKGLSPLLMGSRKGAVQGLGSSIP